MSMLDRIIEVADGLTEPHVNREPYTVWDGSRHRKTHHHVTIQHGLLTQLHRAALLPVAAVADGPSAGIPASRPPLEVEALSRHDQIGAAARGWCARLSAQPRASAESTIRALVGAASTADEADQRALLADLRRWAGWCRVYLGLEHVRRIAGVRCPLADCNTLGALRINLTTSHGLCTACGATWGQESIGVLAGHIKAALSAAT